MPVSSATPGAEAGGAATAAAPPTFTAPSTRREEVVDTIHGLPLPDLVRDERFGGGKAGTRHPNLLLMSADHDDRVDPLHARKFAAEIQHVIRTASAANGEGAGGQARAAAQPVALLRIEQHAGHRGADLLEQLVEAKADQTAFLIHTVE